MAERLCIGKREREKESVERRKANENYFLLLGKKTTQYLVFSEGEFYFSSFEFQKRTWLVALSREAQEQGCFCTLLRLRLKSPLIN